MQSTLSCIGMKGAKKIKFILIAVCLKHKGNLNHQSEFLYCAYVSFADQEHFDLFFYTSKLGQKSTKRQKIKVYILKPEKYKWHTFLLLSLKD